MAQEALILGDQHLPAVRLHATAVFAILNSHSRKEERHTRVIGTLLGVAQEGYIDVTDCFAVPHIEKTDEIYVAINKDYHKSMYSFHKRINRKEAIVGWYTTTLAEGGALIIDNSSLIHEFYSHECKEPIHLVVDTNLAGGDSFNIRAFISQPMIVGDSALANMFQEIKVELCMSEAEVNCINHMIRGQPEGEEFSGPEVLAAVPSAPEQLVRSLDLLVSLVDKISAYVTDVVEGKRAPDAEVGVMLADITGSLQAVDPADFQQFIESKMQDMLMVSYLSTLTQAQVAIAERLVKVL